MKDPCLSLTAVIMAGGSGSRLWPLSRAKQPKQFLSLHGDQTMLQSTMNRLSSLDIKSSLTICNEDHRFFVAEQLREIDKLGSIILEPIGRNTAPTIALAALKSDADDLLLVLAADHVIQDQVAFTAAVNKAIPLAQAGKLVTFGIVPDTPNSGYGYIKRGKREGNGFSIDSFVEKPSIDVAERYLLSGDYYWNSGMFLFKACDYLDELNKFCPDIYRACEESIGASDTDTDTDFIRVGIDKFQACPSESVDYAVMENTDRAVVVEMDAGWNDIGSWASLWDISDKDEYKNCTFGDVTLHECNNSYVRADDKLIAALGVEDLVIVSTKDALLVAHKESVEKVKFVVNNIKNESRSEWENHREVFRPWGKYDSVDKGESYQVKRITVNPGAKLSVQMHHHRSEHWVVVAGSALVTKGDRVFKLSVNESTYISKGEIHALENPNEIPLEIIEIQTGSYLGEDDIVRYDDIYGRVTKI